MIRRYFLTVCALLMALHTMTASSQTAANATKTEPPKKAGQPVNRSATYNMNFVNPTGTYIMIAKNSDQCMYNAGPADKLLNPGDTWSFGLEDSNNWTGGCTNQLKKVTWDVTVLRTGRPFVCQVSFTEGKAYEHPSDSDPKWYTSMDGCGEVITSATCNGVDCRNKRGFYGTPDSRTIRVTFGGVKDAAQDSPAAADTQ